MGVNLCSQCVLPGRLCRFCRTFLCKEHYHSHSCMIDRDPDRADERSIQEGEALDEHRRAERDRDLDLDRLD